MTRDELANVLHRIELACGVKLGCNDPESAEQAIEIYWEFLSVLPDDAINHAAKDVIINTSAGVFPSVRALMQAAGDFLQGNELSWSEAWEVVRKFNIEHSEQRAYKEMATLPQPLQTTIRRLGLSDLRNGKVSIEIFRDVYSEVMSKQRGAILMPTVEDHTQLRKPQNEKMREFHGQR